MKRKIYLFSSIVIALSISLSSCGEDDPVDECSSELGDISDRYNCSAPVLPQICTVDGVDDHYVLDGVEYDCNGDCTEIPEDLTAAILAKEGCGTKKSLDLKVINKELSEQAKIILANLKMEAALCRN